MERRNEGRSQAVSIALTDEEYNLLEQNWKNSTIIHLSEYIRRVLFEKPITFYTRNQSLDEIMTELILLRRDLGTIQLNLDQTLAGLRATAHLSEVQLRLDELEREQSLLISQMNEIKLKINSISLIWLQ